MCLLFGEKHELSRCEQSHSRISSSWAFDFQSDPKSRLDLIPNLLLVCSFQTNSIFKSESQELIGVQLQSALRIQICN